MAPTREAGIGSGDRAFQDRPRRRSATPDDVSGTIVQVRYRLRPDADRG